MKTDEIEESNKSTKFRTKCDSIVLFLNYSMRNEYSFVIEHNRNLKESNLQRIEPEGIEPES